MFRAALFALFVLVCTCISRAQAPAPKPAPAAPIEAPPERTGIVPADVEYATRLAVAQGVTLLKKVAEADPQGWIIPPIQRVRITGYNDVPKKYRMVEVNIPIYEYTDVIVFIPSSSPGEPPTRQVRKQPTKQVGTRKESHLQWDPNGDKEMIYKQPIYEHVGDTSWQFSLIGDSAMALTALRAAGVPENDMVIQRMVDNIVSFIDTYGVPDQTWNVAWLAIAMAQTEGYVGAELTEKLASRLLDGQITDGKARGLWGPMCVNPRLVSILVRDYLASEAEVAKRKDKLKDHPTKANQALVSDAEGARSRLKRYADSWTHTALRFGTVEFPLVWDSQAQQEKIQFMGSTDFYYNQRSADMDSTWAALNALAVCADQKRLPKQSIRPIIPAYYGTVVKIGEKAKAAPVVDSQLNATTMPPEQSMAVLARAANALAALQPKDGGWSQCNFHQPVNDFDAFTKFLPVPVDAASFPPLESPVTPLSAAQGVAALDCIGRAVGIDKMAKYQPNHDAGARGRTVGLQELLQKNWPKPAVRPPAIKPDVFELFLTLTHPLRMKAADTAYSELESQLTRMLLLSSDPDGGWGARFRRTYIPSSSRERFKAMENLTGQNWKNFHMQYPVELRKAHVSYYNVVASDYLASPGAAFATATAVYYLASRLKDAGATLQQLSADPTLADQRKAVEPLLLPPPPKPPAPVVKPVAKAAVPVAKPAAKPEEAIPAIPLKAADTKPKADETFGK